MKNCRECSNAVCTRGRVDCKEGFWGSTYSLETVIKNRAKCFSQIAKKCEYYSPPEIATKHSKTSYNRMRIARIIEAVRDERKHWSYDNRPQFENAYWEEWE